MAVPASELAGVSYLDIPSVGGRAVNLMPLWDGEQWHSWEPTADGRVDVRPTDVVGDYVARAPMCEHDIIIPFVEFMWQRASWPEVCWLIEAIAVDFHNMAASIGKLHLIHECQDRLPHPMASRFVATEMEYLLTVARSVFDLLQETISLIWHQRIRLRDDYAERHRRGRPLPRTFSDIVLRGGIPKTAAEIEGHYHLPAALACKYAEATSFFSRLRGARDRIVHSGGSPPMVFVTEKGFCVSPSHGPFKSFDGWGDSWYNEHLVSLVPWVADVVAQTIRVSGEMVQTLASFIQFPAEIAPGYHIFIRDPTMKYLVEMLGVHGGASPWWEPPLAGTAPGA